jgi:hypothetical protein
VARPKTVSRTPEEEKARIAEYGKRWYELNRSRRLDMAIKYAKEHRVAHPKEKKGESVCALCRFCKVSFYHEGMAYCEREATPDRPIGDFEVRKSCVRFSSMED